MSLTFGSVCSGIEAASVAWKPLGWRCAFMSEIEAFPRAVLKHRFPEVPLHGDFTTIKAGEYEPIDLLVGGTPCQSFSVAGLRGGLDDERGSLALEYLRLADRLRPRWLVWENVPGVLSSNGGRDFGSILGGLVELGYGFAYRVLDAQFFGVAQRRRRVFVVGHLGDWRRAAAVLFERHSLQGHPAPRREAGEGASPSPALRAKANSSHRADRQAYVADTLRGHPRPGSNSVGALAFGGGNTSGPVPVAAALAAHGRRQDFEVETFIAHSLRAEGFDASEDGTGRGTSIIPILEVGKGSSSRGAGPNGTGIGQAGDPMYTLQAGAQHAVAFALRGREDGAIPEISGEQTGALRSASGGSSRDYVAFNTRQDPIHGEHAQPLGAKDNGHGLLTGSAVRRLTPTECERLQGFPDGWTDISWRGKPNAPDGPRYKALGNSMAVPCMAWIGERIAAVEALSPHRSAA